MDCGDLEKETSVWGLFPYYNKEGIGSPLFRKEVNCML